MSGSSPAGYTTSTQTATPGGSGLDYMNQGLGFGGNLYNQGSTHAFLNGDQTSGLNEIARIANSGNQTANQFYDLAQGFTGGKYLNSNIANPGLQSVAGNGMNTNGWQAGLSGLATAANRDNPAFRTLGDTASGRYLDPSTNPWLKSTYDQAFGNIQNSVGSAMAGAGRFGSGAMAGALGSGATNLANELYGGQYEKERSLQEAAKGKIGDLYNTGTGLGISAYSNAGQLAAGDRSGVLGALGQLSGNYNAGLDATTRMAALSPALNEARYGDMAHLLQAGAGFQQDAQGGLSEPWQRLSDYMGLARGMPMTNTQSTSNPYYSNSTGQALSGALGGSALLSQLFGGSGALGTGPSLASQLGLGTAAKGAWNGLSSLFGGGGSNLSGYMNNFTDPLGTGTGGNLSSAAFPDLYTDPATGQSVF